MASSVVVSSQNTAGPSRLINDQTLRLNAPGYTALTPNRLPGIRVVVSSESVELPDLKRQVVRQFGRGGRGSKPGLAATSISELDVQGSSAHQTPPPITAASTAGTQSDGRVFGRGGLGTRRPRHVDPKPLPTPEELRAQMASSGQGANKVRRAGRGGAASAPIALKGKEPSPGSKGEISPSPSVASLKPKLMQRPKFKGILVGRTKGSNDSLSHSQPSSSPRSLSLRSASFLAPRSRFSSDTIITSGGMESENGSYLIPNQPPNSEVATTVRSYSPPLSTASTWSMHEEEGIPLTPITTRSGIARPGSPGDLDFLRQTNYVLGGVPSTVIRSAEFLNIRMRAFPTATQDDLSLDLQTLASKRESLNRINRRASVSVTSMLSSSSSPTPSNLPNPSFLIDDADDRDQYPMQGSIASMDPGHRGEGSSTALLPPMVVENGSSPEATANLSPPVAHENDDDNIVTPTSRRQTTPFASSRSSDPRSEGHSHPPGTRSRSHSHSRSASRASSSEAAWHTRPDTPFLDHPPHIEEPDENFSPAQVQAQKRQVEIELAGQVSGPAFVSRYEPKQGWVGVWNRGDMEDVIDSLRELRSPKGPY